MSVSDTSRELRKNMGDEAYEAWQKQLEEDISKAVVKTVEAFFSKENKQG